MSTTVSYKGNTITSLTNETKTLTTAGKWLEGNIVITDTSSGGTAAISVVDTPDSHGGTVRTITALDISDTTAVASDVAQGKYFYTAQGVKTAGTGSGGGGATYTRTVIAPQQTVTPTSNGTYLAATLNTSAFESGADYIITYNGTEYFYTCTVMWNTNYVLGDINYFYGNTEYPYPFGIIWMSGNTCTMACGDSTTVTVKIEKIELVGDAVPTQHTIYFEFSDETDTTITAYYDSTFISDAITATTPTTYGQKTVTLAELDGVAWYEYDPSETWETLIEGNISYEPDTPYPYCWIPDLGSTTVPMGSVWRITFNNIEYRCTVTQIASENANSGLIGNPLYDGGTDDGSGVPFSFFQSPWGAWSGGADVSGSSAVPVKIERLVTS